MSSFLLVECYGPQPDSDTSLQGGAVDTNTTTASSPTCFDRINNSVASWYIFLFILMSNQGQEETVFNTGRRSASAIPS